MFERIIRFSIEHRWLVLLAVLGMAALGAYSYQKLPIDAVPDITNVQVQINTAAPGYSPLEVEQRLLKFVPSEYLQHAHHWLILHGRYTCVARKPLCEKCIINDLCHWPAKTLVQ